MEKIISEAEVRRNKRDANIMKYYDMYKDKISPKLSLWLHIGKLVGCSHITVYRVIKEKQ